jgi:hypothetical protein
MVNILFRITPIGLVGESNLPIESDDAASLCATVTFGAHIFPAIAH